MTRGKRGDWEPGSIEIGEARDITPEILGDKASVLDVLGRTGSGDIIEVEVQLRNLGNMDRRSLFMHSLKTKFLENALELGVFKAA
jgi:hypothetical protein